jgi:hypothetical protein
MEGNVENRGTYETWKQEFMLAVMDNERSFPLGSENRHTGAFATAVRTAMSTENFEETISAMFIREKRVRGDNAFQLVFRGFLADQLEHTGDDTFCGLDDPQQCLEELERIQDDPDRWGFFYANLLGRQIQSNIADRDKVIPLLTSLMPERFEAPPSYLDIGSSELHGQIKAVFGSDPDSECPPFSETEIVHREKVRTYRADQELSRLANVAISSLIEYGAVVGVDMTNIDDPLTKRWVEICSLKPYERADPANVEEFRLLDKIDPNHERIGFIRADFSSEEDFDLFREQSPVEKYDIVSIKTVLHQLRRQERINMLKHAREVMSDRGILIVQEFLGGNTSKKFNYLTEVVDMQLPNDDPQAIVRWENGRCRRGIFECGSILFGNKVQNIEEALLAQEV